MSATLRPLEHFAMTAEVPSQTTQGITYHPVLNPDGSSSCDCESGKKGKGLCWHRERLRAEKAETLNEYWGKIHGWSRNAVLSLEEVIAGYEAGEESRIELSLLRRLILRLVCEAPDGKVTADPVYDSFNGELATWPGILGSALASLQDDGYIYEITCEMDGERLVATRKSKRNGQRPIIVYRVSAEGRQHFQDKGD